MQRFGQPDSLGLQTSADDAHLAASICSEAWYMALSRQLLDRSGQLQWLHGQLRQSEAEKLELKRQVTRANIVGACLSPC